MLVASPACSLRRGPISLVVKLLLVLDEIRLFINRSTHEDDLAYLGVESILRI